MALFFCFLIKLKYSNGLSLIDVLNLASAFNVCTVSELYPLLEQVSKRRDSAKRNNIFFVVF